MSEKIEQILTNFKDEAKKHKTIEKNFIVRLIKIIEKNKDSMTIVNNKFKFDTIFFSNFVFSSEDSSFPLPAIAKITITTITQNHIAL